jgi:hypothetical protein
MRSHPFSWGVIVAFVSIILVIAFMGPPYDRRRLQLETRCWNNLRQLDAATESVALEQAIATNGIVLEARIIAVLPHKTLPKCPEGGRYLFGVVGREPTCSIHSAGIRAKLGTNSL